MQIRAVIRAHSLVVGFNPYKDRFINLAPADIWQLNSVLASVEEFEVLLHGIVRGDDFWLPVYHDHEALLFKFDQEMTKRRQVLRR